MEDKSADLGECSYSFALIIKCNVEPSVTTTHHFGHLGGLDFF